VQSAFRVERGGRRELRTIAYLTSLYARATDSFIRAEVLQLRSFGHTVHTFSVREPGAAELVSEEIRGEHARTDYILKHGFLHLLSCAVLELLRTPAGWRATLALAARCGWPGVKGRLWPFAYFLEACYLSRQLRARHVGHLHEHIGEGAACVAMLASSLSGTPYSFTVHGPTEFDRPELLALAEKVRHSRFTVVVSQYGRSQLFRWTDPQDWAKIHVVRCGVRFGETPVRPPSAERRLVCIGGLREQKGHLALVEAIALLKAEPAFEVVLVGDGPLRGSIEARAQALGVRERVRITGWMPADKVREEILRSRAVVVSSFAEGLPVVLMEAFALERPVIATAIAGIPELVEPGVSGWLIPASAIDALSEAMREVLSADVSRLAGMGRAGAARVREYHDQTREARKLQALIESPDQ
jgi:glycosyltransferase involved in cell wall biosynthesis